MTKKQGRSVMRHAKRVRDIMDSLLLFDAVASKRLGITVTKISDSEIEISTNHTRTRGFQPLCIGC